jgi:hypothetical protein
MESGPEDIFQEAETLLHFYRCHHRHLPAGADTAVGSAAPRRHQ